MVQSAYRSPKLTVSNNVEVIMKYVKNTLLFCLLSLTTSGLFAMDAGQSGASQKTCPTTSGHGCHSYQDFARRAKSFKKGINPDQAEKARRDDKAIHDKKKREEELAKKRRWLENLKEQAQRSYDLGSDYLGQATQNVRNHAARLDLPSIFAHLQKSGITSYEAFRGYFVRLFEEQPILRSIARFVSLDTIILGIYEQYQAYKRELDILRPDSVRFEASKSTDDDVNK